MIDIAASYRGRENSRLRSRSPYFCKARARTAAELQTLVHTIIERIGRHLERTSKLVRDEQSSYLALESPREGEDALTGLPRHSSQYRIAMGPHKGRKAFMLQSLPPLSGDRAGESLAKAAGFSLHVEVATEAHQRGASGALHHPTARGDRTALAHTPGQHQYL